MGQKKKTNAENNNTTVVLKVDMHCEGCASKIIRCLRAFQGVETVKAENDTGKITVTGNVDPTKIRDKLAEKMKKKVELLSPQPQPKKEKEKEKEKEKDNKTEDKKPKEPPVTTVVLKVALHCQGCVDKISKIVLKTKGVHNMSIDKDKETISVKGTMDVKALVGNLMDKLKRKVEVVPPKKDKEGGGGADNKKKNKGGGNGGGGDNNGNEEGGGKMEQGKMEYLAPPAFGFAYANAGGYNYVPIYPDHFHLHPPQMFSDENPNACSVM